MYYDFDENGEKIEQALTKNGLPSSIEPGLVRRALALAMKDKVKPSSETDLGIN